MPTYVTVEPDTSTLQYLEKLQSYLPFKPVKPHLTLIYTEKDLPDAKSKVDPELKVKTSPLGIKFFPSNQSVPIVLLVDPGKILKRHEYWTQQGFEHTFSPYVPHVTLCYIPPENKLETVQWVKILNSKLMETKVPELIFDHELVHYKPNVLADLKLGWLTKMDILSKSLPRIGPKPLPKIGPKKLPKIGPKTLTVKLPGQDEKEQERINKNGVDPEGLANPIGKTKP